MKVVDILENMNVNPFEEYVHSSDDERRAYEDRKKQAQTYPEKRLRNQINLWKDNGVIVSVTANRKQPNEIYVIYNGSKYIVNATDPNEIAKIQRTVEKHSRVVAASVHDVPDKSSIKTYSNLAKKTRQRFPLGDAAIIRALTRAKFLSAYGTWVYVDSYIHYAVTSPWPEIEPLIFTSPLSSPKVAATYVNKAYPGVRWKPFEDNIVSLLNKNSSTFFDTSVLSHYAALHLKMRWPEVEPLLLDGGWDSLDQYINVLTTRWPEYEAKVRARSKTTKPLSPAELKYAKRLLPGGTWSGRK